MDLFLQEDFLTEIPWSSSEAATRPAVPGAFLSAFLPYGAFTADNNSSGIYENRTNLNKRMIAMLRSIHGSRVEAEKVDNSGQCYRHMITERQRRKKMKQSFKDLHALLPPGTKANMNSTVEIAGVQLRNLQDQMKELQQRNLELRGKIAGNSNSNAAAGFSKIKFRVENPSDAVESMIQVLKRLKTMELRAVTINSDLSVSDFSAAIEIESNNIGTREVEAAVKNTLMETERKFLVCLPET
ncbi:hypothetical protein H6P81_005460 [Aristolochia fimbriata]|uniref:BHLH domain-containing protein n=1 Tax=Aristolochia fimbriata TaxID=158543 RepID=A0AAV7EVM0_ARIFI|nr:hypothetical protein H6P81_005460 [Aristolochia fimbriata]